ncbi:UNVERIFIED_CONTAM: Pentatricopeptide repeat-containing protein, mitochondrial [Sesamum angustifolium]|uniref:Pentatricopeptide repeat-containing protein, mitochondrial n=1 Tax=Sesamum angustifolium TaxID=2727405 RepID=A0AAW2LWS2_9LAMI
MLQRLSVSQALCETRRFLRNVSLPLLADYRPPAYHVVPLSWFNHCSKIQAWPVLILHRTLLTNPNFRYGRNSSSTVEYSVRLSSSLWDQILRQFCSLEAFESEKATDTHGSDNVDKVYKTVLDYSNPEYKMEGALDKLGIELTTPLVVEVLHRLRFEEKLAFRFFNWAGHQEHYNHEPESYNKMIDILSSTKYKVKQFRIICDLLDYMKRSKKNSVPIEVLLTILRQYTEKHLTHLQKFAKEEEDKSKDTT